MKLNEYSNHFPPSNSNIKFNRIDKEYKGIFYGDNTAKKYFEGGAHFEYNDLCKRLEILFKSRPIKVENDILINRIESKKLLKKHKTDKLIGKIQKI